MRRWALAAILLLIASPAVAADVLLATEEERPDERLALRYQATVATQWHPAFRAPYSGQNSMPPAAESATSVVMDLAAGARLWGGAEVWIQPELAGGRGLGSTLGVAAFPSGEVYRVGDPAPTFTVARAFLRQVIGLGGGRSRTEAGFSQLAGARDRDALTIAVGRVAVNDFFDSNPLSSDPHTGFTSWGLWASAAYDYPADTRGYTWGVAADLTVDWWSARAGMFHEPNSANGMDMEWNVLAAHGLVAELEARYRLGGRPGAARLLGFLNVADMGSYATALGTASPPSVVATRAQGRTKAGFAASANQDLGGGLGVFLRLSYNDGQNESWAFTEIDHSLALGAVQSGSRWSRPDDQCGLGLVVSGISGAHRSYLRAGGYGFIIGDGALRYGLEVLGELYYRLALTSQLSLAAAYQPIFDPAYNAERGPIHVFTGRFHAAL